MKKLLFLAAFSLAILSCKKEVTQPAASDTPYEYTGDLGDIVRIVSRDSFNVSQITSLMPPEISSFSEPHLKVYKFVIEYKSIDQFGVPKKASGVVFIPALDSFAIPLASFQHGTVLERTGAPSMDTHNSDVYNLLNLTFSSEDSVVTCVPDYFGLGTGDGLHLYLNPVEEANAVRDMMRAARKLLKQYPYTQLNGQVFLYGYSEGGHATMAAQRQLEKENANEFKLTASSPMAGPYALSRTSQFNVMLDSIPYASPFYLPYVAVSLFNTFHVYSSYSQLFKPPYDSLIPLIIDGNHTAGYANSVFPSVVSTMLIDSVKEAIKNDPNHPIRLALRDYDLVDDWTPTTPMRLYHCHADDQVFFDNSTYADSVFKARGANIELYDYGDLTHVPCAPPSLLSGKTWFVTLFKIKRVK